MAVEIPRLLITDDDAELRETLCSALEPRGFVTLTAADGEQALEIVRHETVHIVLVDMHMPKLTGLEFLRRVKEYRALLPCILMSARLDEVLVEKARRARADLVLSKPFSLGQLIRGVQEALAGTYNWPLGGRPGLLGRG